MAITLTPAYRAAAVGAVTAGLLIGAFALGTGQSHAAPPSRSRISLTSSATSAGAGRVTVSGTGNVTGTPNQLILSMGVQVNSSSVGSALSQANQAVRDVTGALEHRGVRHGDIQTADLSIEPNYSGSSQVPTGYDVSESLTATLNNLRAAGAEIQAAARSGGNATTVDGVSLNLTDTGPLLASARTRAMADAKARATGYARAVGQQLGRVISVSEQSAPQPFPVFAANAAATSGHAAAVPISPGSQKLSVTVTVVYALS